MDRGRGRRPSPKPSSTLVGPQQRARAHHEEQPGDAASFGEGGLFISQQQGSFLLVDAPCDRRGSVGARGRTVDPPSRGVHVGPVPYVPGVLVWDLPAWRPAWNAMWCRAWARAGRNAGSSWAWAIATGRAAHPHLPGPRLALVPYVPVVVWGWARDPLTVRRVQGCSERLHTCAPCSARDPRGRGR